MPGEPIDNRTLLRRTLLTTCAMVGASIALVGTLTLALSSVVGRAVGQDDGVSEPAGHAASPAPKNAPGGVKSR